MQARSALFALYGDYLRAGGGRTPVAALVRLLAPLGFTAPAVRTAVSRMVRQGWLQPVRTTGGPGYALSRAGVRRLDEAQLRGYQNDWNGRFDLIVTELPGQRERRTSLASGLADLGYGMLFPTTWIAPRPVAAVAALLERAGVAYERFLAGQSGGAESAQRLVSRAWDLPAMASRYEALVERLRPVVAGPHDDEQAYVARTTLVHAWREFLSHDPRLPQSLLPDPWPGVAAAAFVERHATRLRTPAERYVERCLELPARRATR